MEPIFTNNKVTLLVKVASENNNHNAFFINDKQDSFKTKIHKTSIKDFIKTNQTNVANVKLSCYFFLNSPTKYPIISEKINDRKKKFKLYYDENEKIRRKNCSFSFSKFSYC